MQPRTAGLAQDLRAIAKVGDLDLEKGEDREEALDRLEAVHVRLGDMDGPMRASCGRSTMSMRRRRRGFAVERLMPLGRDLADERPDVFAPSERQDFQQLVAQFRRTDFDHPFSDDPSVRRAGAVEVEEARAALNAWRTAIASITPN